MRKSAAQYMSVLDIYQTQPLGGGLDWGMYISLVSSTKDVQSIHARVQFCADDQDPEIVCVRVAYVIDCVLWLRNVFLLLCDYVHVHVRMRVRMRVRVHVRARVRVRTRICVCVCVFGT